MKQPKLIGRMDGRSYFENSSGDLYSVPTYCEKMPLHHFAIPERLVCSKDVLLSDPDFEAV